MNTRAAGFRGETVEVTAAGVRVLPDQTSQDDTTVPDITGRPDIERPIGLTDTPGPDNPVRRRRRSTTRTRPVCRRRLQHAERHSGGLTGDGMPQRRRDRARRAAE